MSDLPEPVVTHPVALCLAGGKDSEKTPHVGPDLAAYRATHIAWMEGRDRWWHKDAMQVPSYCPPHIMAAIAKSVGAFEGT
ncbi:hypothetical protein B0H13DRAFT_2361127 [Mycena leptocephala]|nr:hypothetical protein B0H13DRAFT_2361127 [Mycena leptocephala]